MRPEFIIYLAHSLAHLISSLRNPINSVPLSTICHFDKNTVQLIQGFFSVSLSVFWGIIKNVNWPTMPQILLLPVVFSLGSCSFVNNYKTHHHCWSLSRGTLNKDHLNCRYKYSSGGNNRQQVACKKLRRSPPDPSNNIIAFPNRPCQQFLHHLIINVVI